MAAGTAKYCLHTYTLAIAGWQGANLPPGMWAEAGI